MFSKSSHVPGNSALFSKELTTCYVYNKLSNQRDKKRIIPFRILSICICLTLYDTIPTFNNPEEESF